MTAIPVLRPLLDSPFAAYMTTVRLCDRLAGVAICPDCPKVAHV